MVRVQRFRRTYCSKRLRWWKAEIQMASVTVRCTNSCCSREQTPFVSSRRRHCKQNQRIRERRQQEQLFTQLPMYNSSVRFITFLSIGFSAVETIREPYMTLHILIKTYIALYMATYPYFTLCKPGIVGRILAAMAPQETTAPEVLRAAKAPP